MQDHVAVPDPARGAPAEALRQPAPQGVVAELDRLAVGPHHPHQVAGAAPGVAPDTAVGQDLLGQLPFAVVAIAGHARRRPGLEQLAPGAVLSVVAGLAAEQVTDGVRQPQVQGSVLQHGSGQTPERVVLVAHRPAAGIGDHLQAAVDVPGVVARRAQTVGAVDLLPDRTADLVALPARADPARQHALDLLTQDVAPEPRLPHHLVAGRRAHRHRDRVAGRVAADALVHPLRGPHGGAPPEGVVVDADPVVAHRLLDDAAERVPLEGHAAALARHLDQAAVGAIAIGGAGAVTVLDRRQQPGGVVLILGAAPLRTQQLADPPGGIAQVTPLTPVEALLAIDLAGGAQLEPVGGAVRVVDRHQALLGVVLEAPRPAPRRAATSRRRRPRPAPPRRGRRAARARSARPRRRSEAARCADRRR